MPPLRRLSWQDDYPSPRYVPGRGRPRPQRSLRRNGQRGCLPA